MSLTILHVEDDQIVADAVRVTLEAEGWRVVGCADGAAALGELASPERYDLLITDNGLPKVGGLDVISYARILRHRMRLPVLMLSADDCQREALRAGADAFLQKPEGLELLVPTVRRLTGRGAGR